MSLTLQLSKYKNKDNLRDSEFVTEFINVMADLKHSVYSFSRDVKFYIARSDSSILIVKISVSLRAYERKMEKQGQRLRQQHKDKKGDVGMLSQDK